MGAIPILGQIAKRIAAPAIIHASKYWTPRRMAETVEQAAPKRRVAAHGVEGVIENRKLLMLEPRQALKYRHAIKRARYGVKASLRVAQGKCDATGVFSNACLVFFPKELLESH